MKLAYLAAKCPNCRRSLYVRKGIRFMVGTAPCPMCNEFGAIRRQRSRVAPVLAFAYCGPGLMGPPEPVKYA